MIVFVQILGDAADAIAAHLCFAAVGIEDPHPGCGAAAWPRIKDRQDSVGPDAQMSVAQIRDDASVIQPSRRRGLAQINDYKVVANPFHFQKRDWG